MGIKRFFECLVPVSVCNLECPYCYIIQEDRRAMTMAEMPYSPEHIAHALRQERVGGTCLFSICGAGETLAQKEVVPIAAELLKKGHFVNITTNGTLSRRFDELIAACAEHIGHLHISFSLHYTELLRRGWVDTFFDNVCKMRDAGASILVQINLCDDYLPYLTQIKEICMEKVGAYPQVALTRDEQRKPFGIFTKGSESDYIANGKSFSSPLFDFTVENFCVKRKEFCFAGDWSGTLNLQTGVLTKCYANYEGVNIFADVDGPIPFEAVGKHCGSPYCVNSSHFMSLGVIPSLKTPTYAQLRNRVEASWYTPEMETFLNGKLSDNNCVFWSKLRYYRSRLTIRQLRQWYPDSRLHMALRWMKRTVLRILRLNR